MQFFNYVSTFGRSIITFMHVQLFITLISLPILLCWGMPLSLLSFAGNFFFGPILTGFLLISSLIFFFELLALPNYYLIYVLEKLTYGWMYIMQVPSCTCLLALPKPPIAMACAIAFVTLLILHCKRIDTPVKGIVAYTFVLLISGTLLTLSAHWSTPIQTLDCNSGHITIAYHHKTLVVIDPGVIGQRISASNWCEYTLIPYLAKEFGTTQIDHLILLQPNGLLFAAIAHLIEKTTIKKIYIPFWSGTIPAHWWRHYFTFMAACKKHKCTLIRLNPEDLRTIYLGNSSMSINPLENPIIAPEFSYPAFKITGIIDQSPLEIYSRKYKKA